MTSSSHIVKLMTIRLFTLHHQIYMSNGEEEDGEDGMGCAACAYHFFLTPMLAILFPLCIFSFNIDSQTCSDIIKHVGPYLTIF